MPLLGWAKHWLKACCAILQLNWRRWEYELMLLFQAPLILRPFALSSALKQTSFSRTLPSKIPVVALSNIPIISAFWSFLPVPQQK